MTRRIASDKHRWALPLLVALVIAEVAIFGSFMWITSPQTTFAPGFKEELFRGLKIGTAQTEVTRVLCRLSLPMDHRFSKPFPHPGPRPRRECDVPYAAPFCPAFSAGLRRLRYDSPSTTRSDRKST